MPFSRSWQLVDVFTLDQAACLWCGTEPISLEFNSSISGDIAAIYQALVGASKRGELDLDHSTNVMGRMGNFHKSLVSRDALTRYARSKNQFPPFLFDSWDSEGTATSLPRQFRDERTKASRLETQESEAQERKSRVGRPQEYDWNSCFGEIVRVADMDGLPSTQAELVRHLMGWFEERFGKSPADSVLKSKTSQFINTLVTSAGNPVTDSLQSFSANSG